MPLRTAGCTASRHARPEKPPERHVGGCAGAWAQSGRLPRQAPCRCCYLARSRSSSLTGPRGTLFSLPGKLLLPGHCCLDGARGASRQVHWSVLVGLPGKLLLLGSCLLSLNTLFLDGFKGTLGDLGVRSASLCRGVLQLPVHKFGVLGYPYSSTPTMPPRSIFHHIIFYFPSYKFLIYNFSFLFTFFAIFYFPIYKPRTPKIFTLLFIYLYQISLCN